MEDLFSQPLTYVVILAIAGLIWRGGQWMGSVNTDRDSFKTFMREVRDDIKEIRSHIIRIFQKLDPEASTVERGSHLRLSKLGRDLSDRLDAKDWAKRAAPTLGDAVMGMTPYQLQDFCFEYVGSLTFEDNEDLLIHIQACAFDHGLTERQVRDVLAVELRDLILQFQQGQKERTN